MPGGAEVDENGAAGGSKHNVRGLYVPMNKASRPKFRNCRRDITPYWQHFEFRQRSAFQPIAQRFSVYEFPRDVSGGSTGHATITMFNQPSQGWMRDVFHRADLALYATVLTGIEVQLQSYNVISRCAVWPGSPGCLKNCSLTTNGNFGTNAVPPTQRSFYICRHKRVDIHTINDVSGRSAYVSLSRDAREPFIQYTRESYTDRKSV